jgi:hypothetical protein
MLINPCFVFVLLENTGPEAGKETETALARAASHDPETANATEIAAAEVAATREVEIGTETGTGTETKTETETVKMQVRTGRIETDTQGMRTSLANTTTFPWSPLWAR